MAADGSPIANLMQQNRPFLAGIPFGPDENWKDVGGGG